MVLIRQTRRRGSLGAGARKQDGHYAKSACEDYERVPRDYSDKLPRLGDPSLRRLWFCKKKDAQPALLAVSVRIAPGVRGATVYL